MRDCGSLLRAPAHRAVCDACQSSACRLRKRSAAFCKRKGNVAAAAAGTANGIGHAARSTRRAVCTYIQCIYIQSHPRVLPACSRVLSECSPIAPRVLPSAPRVLPSAPRVLPECSHSAPACSHSAPQCSQSAPQCSHSAPECSPVHAEQGHGAQYSMQGGPSKWAAINAEEQQRLCAEFCVLEKIDEQRFPLHPTWLTNCHSGHGGNAHAPSGERCSGAGEKLTQLQQVLRGTEHPGPAAQAKDSPRHRTGR